MNADRLRQVQEWATRFDSSATRIEVRSELELVVVGLSSDVDLASAPPHLTLTFEELGPKKIQIEFTCDVSPPDQIRVGSVSSFLKSIVFRQAEGTTVQRVDLNLEAAERRKITIAGVRADRIQIRGRALLSDVRSGEMELHDHSLIDLDETGWNLKKLEMHGLVQLIKGDQLRTEESVTHGAVIIGSTGAVWLGSLRGSQEGEPAEISLHPSASAVHLDDVTDGSRLRLYGGALAFRSAPPPAGRQIESLRIEGFGIINVSGVLVAPDIRPTDPRGFELRIYERAQVLEASGAVGLDAHPRSVCSGAPGNPLVLTTVHQSQGAEIQEVDIYSLRVGDLLTLSEAERFSPWIPTSRRTARRREDAMGVGGATEGVKRRQRAHLWARLTNILAGTHASGNVQSQVRYAAARARRKAIPWNREKFLLSMYSLIGYGERIMWPLYWLGALSFILTPVLLDPEPSGLCCERADEFLRTWGELLLSPLAFFRFVDVPVAVSFGEQAALLLLRTVGLLLLFFTLAAARRVTKPE